MARHTLTTARTDRGQLYRGRGSVDRESSNATPPPVASSPPPASPSSVATGSLADGPRRTPRALTACTHEKLAALSQKAQVLVYVHI